MNSRTTAILATAVLAATLTACGSSDDKATAPETSAASSQPPATTSASSTAPADETAAVKTAVAAYTDAYFAADTDTAYSALSARCAGKINKAQYEAVVKQAATDYGPDHPATDVQAQVSGELARVTYKVTGLPKFDQQAQPWALEGGAWKYDAC